MTTSFRRLPALLALAAGLACAGPPPEPANPVEAHLEAGRFLEAAREAETAVRRDPEDPALRVLAGRAHAGAGNLDRAIAQLEMAHQLSPRDPEISILLGELEQRRENVDDAYVAFRRATRLAPNDIRGWSGLALTAEALGFEAEAVDAYARWAELEREQGLQP
jgi:cytochrome c-type biogenesis protein CcmH/NrfG